MAIALEYKPLIAWRTFAMNVRLLQKETEENPAEYRLKVSPVDRHDLGAGTVDNECYFISFMGNPYTVINAGENFIDVRDDFRVGTAPTAAKIGIVYKSIDKAPFIAPTFYRYLHKTALDNMRKIELTIVWQYATLLNNSWTPKGIIFDFDPETGILSHTAGQLNVANWYSQRPEKRLDPGTEIDTTPVHKAFTVAANSFEITEPDAFYIYALFPIDKNVSTVQFHVSKQYWREKMFDGFICVLIGILNSESDNRELVLNWARTGGRLSDSAIIAHQPGHAFTFGQTIKRNGAGLWILSKADNRANAGTVGIVSRVIDADHFAYVTGGLLPGTFVDGADYFLSTTTAGAIFIQSDPEVWEIGNIREFIGTGTPAGLEIEIDLGDEITEENIIYTPYKTEDREGGFADIIAASAQTYDMDMDAAWRYRIQYVSMRTNVGSLIGVSIKINGINVGGMEAINVTGTKTRTQATGNNIVENGDVVTVNTTGSYTGGVSYLGVKIVIERL